MGSFRKFACRGLFAALFVSNAWDAQAAAAPPPVAASPPSATTVEVPAPAAPTVRLALVDALSTKTALTGQRFALTVSDDVIVDGAVLIPKGATASGTVLFARKKGGAGRTGALDLRVDSVATPSGTIRLKAADSRRGASRGNKAVVAGALVGGLGLFAVQGEEIELPAGHEFVAEVVPSPAPATPASGANEVQASTDSDPAKSPEPR